MKFKDIYPNYEEEKHGDVVLYYVRQALGGRDEDGEFQLVMEGPAEGEKVYLD